MERANAFDSLRRGNVRAYGSPHTVMKALPDGSHAEIDVATALAEPSTTWNGEWSWRLPSTALALHRFELNGELEVWLKYLSAEWIRAYLAGELPEEGPYVRPSDFDHFKPFNNLLA